MLPGTLADIFKASLVSDGREQVHEHRRQVRIHLRPGSFITRLAGKRSQPVALLALMFTQQRRGARGHRLEI